MSTKAGALKTILHKIYWRVGGLADRRAERSGLHFHQRLTGRYSSQLFHEWHCGPRFPGGTQGFPSRFNLFLPLALKLLWKIAYIYHGTLKLLSKLRERSLVCLAPHRVDGEIRARQPLSGVNHSDPCVHSHRHHRRNQSAQEFFPDGKRDFLRDGSCLLC
jgi:hypothetical protein